jgi:hypothetical protein
MAAVISLPPPTSREATRLLPLESPLGSEQTLGGTIGWFVPK